MDQKGPGHFPHGVPFGKHINGKQSEEKGRQQ